MKILALESTARAASVAIMEDGRLIGQYFQCSGLTHSRTLLKMAEELLASTGRTVEQMDAVATAIGPGSFTGVRIGVAAAKGLAWAAEKPVCGVSTLEAMAWQARYHEGIVCPVMDARRGQIYNAVFRISGGRVERLTPDRAIAAEELAEEAAREGNLYFLVGDGAELCYNIFSERKLPAVLAPEHVRMQSAAGVAAAVRAEALTDPGNLTPHYLRLSQAERERLRREQEAKE